MPGMPVRQFTEIGNTVTTVTPPSKKELFKDSETGAGGIQDKENKHPNIDLPRHGVISELSKTKSTISSGNVVSQGESLSQSSSNRPLPPELEGCRLPYDVMTLRQFQHTFFLVEVNEQGDVSKMVLCEKVPTEKFTGANKDVEIYIIKGKPYAVAFSKKGGPLPKNQDPDGSYFKPYAIPSMDKKDEQVVYIMEAGYPVDYKADTSLEKKIETVQRVVEWMAKYHGGKVHRDLKWPNILRVRDGNVQPIDFDMAKKAGETIRQGGTRTHMSPGTNQGFMSKTPVETSTAQDMWAIGVCFLETLLRESFNSTLSKYYLERYGEHGQQILRSFELTSSTRLEMYNNKFDAMFSSVIKPPAELVLFKNNLRDRLKTMGYDPNLLAQIIDPMFGCLSLDRGDRPQAEAFSGILKSILLDYKQEEKSKRQVQDENKCPNPMKKPRLEP